MSRLSESEFFDITTYYIIMTHDMLMSDELEYICKEIDDIKYV